MNKLIINSDDFGYSRAINHAIIDTHQEGILTSATLMTNTPGFEHAVKLAKENPKLGVGVHLVLTFLKPLRDDVPSLVDEDGNFYRPDAHRTGLAIVDVDELYKEWDTQIQKVLDAGIQPTHLDSHHHSHTFNEHHLEVFLKLSEKYDLPIRGNFEEEHSRRTTTYFEPAFDGVGMLEEKEQEEYLELLFDKIKENESTEIMCHTGYIDEFLFKSSSFTEPRIYQVDILTDSNFVDKIQKDQEIQLVNFNDL
ncbi:MAG TPA: carbohydrate deacetylase [Enterococcus sp.]|nr:carbohydrate deacetylase [Enterococcus sp.]